MTPQPESQPSVPGASPDESLTDSPMLPLESPARLASIKYPQLMARCSAIFVWAVYFIALFFVGRFVYLNAVNVPFGDEWDLLWWSTGKLPIDWNWLWSQHNEHRIALSRLIVLAAYAVSGHDFRSGCWVVLGMQALLAAVFILTARFVRGQTTWTDAIFPLALLNLGHAENLLWSFQVQFAGSALFPGILLAMVVRHREGPRQWWEIAVTAGCSLALCGFGASGIVYAPFFVLWQLYVAWEGWRSGEKLRRQRAIALLLTAIATTALVMYYFWGLQRVARHPAPSTVWSSIETATQFCAVGIVANAQSHWEVVRWIVPAMLFVIGLQLLSVLWSNRLERIRGLGILMFLGAFLTLAGGIGWGRAGLGWHASFSLRYVTLSVASVVVTYWSVILYAPRHRRSLIQAILLAATVLTVYLNMEMGVYWANSRIAYLRSFDRELQRGTRTAILIDTYSSEHTNFSLMKMYPSAEALARYVLHLRSLGIGHFQPTSADGDSRFDLAVNPRVTAENATWDSAAHTVTLLQPNGGVTIHLPQADYVQRLGIYLQPSRTLSGLIPCRISAVLKSGKLMLVRDEPLKTSAPLVLWYPIEQEVTGFRITLGQIPFQLQIPHLFMICGKPGKS